MTIDCTYTINYLQKYFFLIYQKWIFKSNKRITQCALLWVLADDQVYNFTAIDIYNYKAKILPHLETFDQRIRK